MTTPSDLSTRVCLKIQAGGQYLDPVVTAEQVADFFTRLNDDRGGLWVIEDVNGRRVAVDLGAVTSARDFPEAAATSGSRGVWQCGGIVTHRRGGGRCQRRTTDSSGFCNYHQPGARSQPKAARPTNVTLTPQPAASASAKEQRQAALALLEDIAIHDDPTPNGWQALFIGCLKEQLEEEELDLTQQEYDRVIREAAKRVDSAGGWNGFRATLSEVAAPASD